MKAPRCKVCGVGHWSREPHEFWPAKPVNRPVANKPAVANKVLAEAAGKRAGKAGRRNRNEYQREYMRRRRAAGKAGR